MKKPDIPYHEIEYGKCVGKKKVTTMGEVMQVQQVSNKNKT